MIVGGIVTRRVVPAGTIALRWFAGTLRWFAGSEVVQP
jgi:hypothetical protein